MNRVQLRFTIIVMIIGLIVSIQYNTVQTPASRDTRDVWEIRQELSKEMQLHSELLKEIRSANDTLKKYENTQSESPEQALRETVMGLRESAGLTEFNGPGLTLVVKPSIESMALGTGISTISPELLTRLINEMNRFSNQAIDIDGKRLTLLSAIRDINGETTVNGLPIKSPPFEIRIGTNTMEEARQVYNALHASNIGDDFFIDNLSLEIKDPVSELTIPAYDQPINNKYLSEAEKE